MKPSDYPYAEQYSKSGSCSRSRAAVGLCRKAGVTKVKPAIHHQVIRFLMAAEGVAENIGGIAYSANSYSLDELRALADEVNEILSQNDKCEQPTKGE